MPFENHIYRKPSWEEVLELIGEDQRNSGPTTKKFLRGLYEYLESHTLEQIETVIDVVKPLYEKQFGNPRPNRYRIIEGR
jgi:hypothetical protein